MKTIIAGGREFTNYRFMATVLKDHDITTVVSGTARGADKTGEEWAKFNNIPVEKHPANWDKHGKSAGYIRNSEMADCSEALVAFWDGKSRGTKHMIDLATKKGLVVTVYNYENTPLKKEDIVHYTGITNNKCEEV